MNPSSLIQTFSVWVPGDGTSKKATWPSMVSPDQSYVPYVKLEIRSDVAISWPSRPA